MTIWNDTRSTKKLNLPGGDGNSRIRRRQVIAALIMLGLGSVVAAAGAVTVYHNPGVEAWIIPNNSCQLARASYLLFAISPAAFSDASADNPAIIRIRLPEGAVPHHSVATGTLETASPLPRNGEIVVPLAVGRFREVAGGIPQPVAFNRALTGVGPNAVQLFKYKQNDGEIWIRITESTGGWLANSYGVFTGFIFGIGPGVWPKSAYTNWGPGQEGKQETTLLFLDLHQYALPEQGDSFPVTLDAFYQFTGGAVETVFQPQSVNLFTAHPDPGAMFVTASPTPMSLTDQTVVDLDRNGREDLCYLDGQSNRLYNSTRHTDSSMHLLNWIESVGVAPVSIDAADVTGDSRPDILVGDATGQLHIYSWEDVSSDNGGMGKDAQPVVALALGGQPSATMVRDVDGDGFVDFVMCDDVANTLTVKFGADFGVSEVLATGRGPIALTEGDLNGDRLPDLAVANRDDQSVSVYLSNGLGGFTIHDLPGLGAPPVDIDSADFNRDGRSDLVVILAGQKALAAMKVPADGSLPGEWQKIFFTGTPSAVVAENMDGLNGPDALIGFSDQPKLALCTSDPNGDLAHTFNLNTLGDVIIDPFEDVTVAQENVISVAGGTSIGGVSSRAGVVTIQEQEFNLLHFPQSRNISFSVVNLSPENSIINLEMYDDRGGIVAVDTETVTPGAQFARYLSDLLGPGTEADQHWVRTFLTRHHTHGIWLLSEGEGMRSIDGARIVDIRDAHPFSVLPVVSSDSGRHTVVTVVNPYLGPTRLTLMRRGSDGQESGIFSTIVNGRSRIQEEAAVLFPGIAEGDYIEIHADRPVIGSETVQDVETLAYLESMFPPEMAHPLYCPHVAVGDFGVRYRSVLTLVNTAQMPAEVSVELFGDDGFSRGQAVLPLAANGKREVDVGTLFGLDSPTSGYLRVDPRGTLGVLGAISFGDEAGGLFRTSLPLMEQGEKMWVMDHIANGALGGIRFFTGMAILNPGLTEQMVTVVAHDQTGAVQDTRELMLMPGERSVFLLDQLMPGLTSLFGGYIIVESMSEGSGVMVFEMFGDTGLNFLSAVPAIPMHRHTTMPMPM